MFFIFSDTIESSYGEHGDVLHMRDLHDARWHSGGRLDRCNVIQKLND